MVYASEMKQLLIIIGLLFPTLTSANCADEARDLAVEIEALFDQRLSSEDWQTLQGLLSDQCTRPSVQKLPGKTVYRTKPKRQSGVTPAQTPPVIVGIDWYSGGLLQDGLDGEFSDPQ